MKKETFGEWIVEEREDGGIDINYKNKRDDYPWRVVKIKRDRCSECGRGNNKFELYVIGSVDDEGISTDNNGRILIKLNQSK